MAVRRQAGVTLDTGALLGVERGSPRMYALLQLWHERSLRILIPAGVLAQAWRGSHRQARLAQLLKRENVTIVGLDAEAALAIGALCGRSGTADIVDASVAHCARWHGHRVVTSDPGDIAKLDPSLELIVV